MEAKLIRIKIFFLRLIAFFAAASFVYYAPEVWAWTGTRMRKSSLVQPVTYDATGPNASGASVSFDTTLSWNHTTSGSNRFLLVSVSVGVTPDTGYSVAVTYNGVAMTSLGKVHTDYDDVGFVEGFFLINPALGTNSVNVTLSGGSADLVGGSVSFNNVNQTTPILSVTSNAGQSTAPSISINTATNHMVASLLAAGCPISTSGQTLRWLHNLNCNTGAGNGAMATTTGSGSVNMTYTLGVSDWWGLIAVDLVPVGEVIPPPTAIAFSTGAQTLTTWQCSTGQRIQAQPNVTMTPITVNLSASSLLFYSDANCQNPITSVTIPAYNSESEIFYFMASPPAGSITMTASATGFSSINQNQTISIHLQTWKGGASCDGNWSTNACWQGNTPPTASQEAHFDSLCTLNCNATLTANTYVRYMWMHSPYAGTITLGGFTFTVSIEFIQESGTLLGGTNSIVLGDDPFEGYVKITGGTFQASSGNTLGTGLRIRGSADLAGTATFNHNGGTTYWTPTDIWGSWINPGTFDFNHFVFQGSNGRHTHIEGILKVNGNLTVQNDANTWFRACDANAEIRVGGNITATSGEPDQYGSCAQYYVKLTLVGSGVQNFSSSANALPGHIRISQAGGGSVNLSGTIHAALWDYTSGAVNAGTSTVALDLREFLNAYHLNSGSMHFYNLSVGDGFSSFWTGVPDSSTTYVDGDLNLNMLTGNMYSDDWLGLFNVQGNVTWNGTGSNTMGITFSGGNAQTFAGNVNLFTQGATINKTAGSVLTLNDNLLTNGNFVNVLSGTLNLGTRILNASGATITVNGASSVINCNGGCGAGTACGQGGNRLRCSTLTLTGGGSIVP